MAESNRGHNDNVRKARHGLLHNAAKPECDRKQLNMLIYKLI